MINVKLKCLLIVCLLLCLEVTFSQKKSTSNPILITSPNGEITLTISSPAGALQYAVNYKKIPVIEASRLGLVVNGKLLGEAASTGNVQQYKLNETYDYRGVHSKAVNHYDGAKINITSTSSSPFVLEARVFNDGVAFRYIVNNTGAAVVDKDTTAFILPAGSTVWWQPNVKYYARQVWKKEAFKNIEYNPGNISAVGYDTKGKQLLTAQINTVGAPVALRLTNIKRPTPFVADGHDLALVEAEVIDAKGNRCPTALNMINYTLDGPAEWRGGMAMEPDNYILTKSFPVEGGVNRFLIRSTTTP